jgi:hypothetical protein
MKGTDDEKRAPKIRILKEKEKIQQVTHWDLDYLPRDEILNLYEQKTEHHQHRAEKLKQTGERHQKLSLLLIATGVFLLAGALYVATLI